MTKDDAMKLALEALKHLQPTALTSFYTIGNRDKAIKALEEALKREQGEPVAWKHAGAMPPEQEEMKKAAYNLAPWLSAALDDPKVCQEYKDAINGWFDTAMPAAPAQEPVQCKTGCDWCALEATQESLREHMARIRVLEQEKADLLFALHDAWPYVHQWCTIESKRKPIQALIVKHGEFADLG